MILFLVFGLLLFTVFQFYVFNGRRELVEPKYLILVFIAFGVSLQTHVFIFTHFLFILSIPFCLFLYKKYPF